MGKLKSASELARKEIAELEPCVHGGEVWEIARKTGFTVHELIDFSSSINPLGPSPRALEAIKNSLDKLHLYPDSNSTALREAIACHFDDLSNNNIIIGNGSTELIYLFAEIFLKKGDVAVVAAPSFGEYANAIVKSGAKPKLVELNQGFQVEPEVFKREMLNAKAVFLCNPNNPTSMLIPHDALMEIAIKARDEEILLFLDEDFIEFVKEEKRHSFANIIKSFPNVFVLRTFTKFFGLTGLRVGYGIADEKTIGVFSKAKMPWNVNSLAQEAALAALADAEHSKRTMEVVQNEKEFLVRELAKIKFFKVFPADTNFIFIDVRQSGFSANQLKTNMLKLGLLVRDCSSFAGLDSYYLRVAVRKRVENSILLDAFRKVLKHAI